MLAKEDYLEHVLKEPRVSGISVTDAQHLVLWIGHANRPIVLEKLPIDYGAIPEITFTPPKPLFLKPIKRRKLYYMLRFDMSQEFRFSLPLAIVDQEKRCTFKNCFGPQITMDSTFWENATRKSAKLTEGETIEVNVTWTPHGFRDGPLVGTMCATWCSSRKAWKDWRLIRIEGFSWEEVLAVSRW